MFECNSLADFVVGHALLDLLDRQIEFFDDPEHEEEYFRLIDRSDEIKEAMFDWEESVFDAR